MPQWIDDLRPGDKVIVERFTLGKTSRKVATVKSKTPKKGWIVLADGMKFNNYGLAVNGNRFSAYLRIKQATPDAIERIRLNESLNILDAEIHDALGRYKRMMNDDTSLDELRNLNSLFLQIAPQLTPLDQKKEC